MQGRSIFSLKRKFSERFPTIRKIYIRLRLYIDYPDSLIRDLKFISRNSAAKKRNITFIQPNFIYHDVFSAESIIVDIGCGFEADISMALINRYQLKAFGIDPTLKHIPKLKQIEDKSAGHFTHLQYALSIENGMVTFNESIQNESGSLLDDHINIRTDQTRSYQVKTITLRDIPQLIKHDSVHLLKVDIEGAEYDVFNKITPEEISPYQQLFIEFHHKSIARYSKNDTDEVVRNICDLGFTYFTMDDINYLFYKTNNS